MKCDSPTIFGARLKRARQEAGLSQEQLGERLQLAERTIRHYEAGTKEPSLRRLPSIARVVHKPVGWFFEEEAGVEARLSAVEPGKRPAGVRWRARQARPHEPAARLQVYAEVPAGSPAFPLRTVLEHVTVPEPWLSDGAEVYGLRVTGESMVPLLLPGDIIAVRRQEKARHGDVVVVTLADGDFVVKRFVQVRGTSSLESVNAGYPVIQLVEGAAINGRVVGLVRHL